MSSIRQHDHKRMNTLLGALLLLGCAHANAFVPPGYQQVARLSQVPEQYFYGIALNESGKQLISRDFRPWPWTLNVEGRAYFYPTRKACYMGLTEFYATRQNTHRHRPDASQLALPPRQVA